MTLRTIEGVLTYLNAFLMLDLARHIFAESPAIAVVIIIIATIITYYLIGRNNAGSPIVAKYVPPAPSNLAETFRSRRHMRT